MNHFFAYMARMKLIRRWSLMKSVSEEDFNKEIQYWIDYYKSYYGVTVTREEVLENLGEATLRFAALSAKIDELLLDRVSVVYA